MNLIKPRSERKRDKHGNIVTRHWDGRQDVTINAKPIVVKTTQESPGT
jgi:hypothetical protein